MDVNYKHTAELHNEKSALEILPFVFNLMDVNSVLDIGCGNGSWLKVAKHLGAKEVYGIDGIEPESRSQFISKDEFLLYNFKQPLHLNRSFDLVMSLEVAEHLSADYADIFVQHLVSHGNVILFSAAIPNQGGQYHLNEQWPDYWHKKFKSHGYKAFDVIRPKFWNNDDVFWWYRQNIILYVKDSKVHNSLGEPVSTVPAIVHPALYQKKMFHPKYLNSKAKVFRHLLSTLKTLFK